MLTFFSFLSFLLCRPTTDSSGRSFANNNGKNKKRDNQSILLVVEGWMLADAADDVIIDLRRLSQGTMPLAITEITTLPEGTSPPTYFETNKFTR